MLAVSQLKPLQRKALLAALESPTHSFQRTRVGFVPAGVGAARHTSGVASVPVFTLRLMRMLDRDYLAEFDDSTFPNRATLTKPGRAIAEQLRDAVQEQAGVA